MTTKPKTGPKGIPAPKAKPAAATATPDVAAQVTQADAETGAEAGPEGGPTSALKLRELVGRVVEATGGKKKGVKEIVEATLTQLGEALAKGEELNLPGVGKVRVARSIDRAGRTMMTLKVRGNGAAREKQPKEALAEADEDV